MNRFTSPEGVSMQRNTAGSGHASLFNCLRCAKPKPQQGRRLRMVQGCKTWVCAGCAK